MAGDIVGTQRRTRGVRLGAVLAAALLPAPVLLTGCGDDSEFEWPDDPVPAATPTVDPAEAAAIDEILTLYDDFRRAEIAAQADPEPAAEAQDEFTDYLADPLLAVTLFELETLHERGLMREGEPSWEPTVTALDLDGTPPTAVLRDCLDATAWRLAHAGSGEPAPADGLPARFRAERHVLEFDVTYVDGAWRLAEARTEGDEAC